MLKITKSYQIMVVLLVTSGLLNVQCLTTTRQTTIKGLSISTGLSTTQGSTFTTTKTTLSPAQQLLIDLGVDASNFKKLEDTIDGKAAGTAPAPAPAPAPAAPKKQLSIGSGPNAQMSDAEKNIAADKKLLTESKNAMAEIEKLNMMNSPPAPNSKAAAGSGPAAQSNALPSSGSSSSSSESSGSSSNAKIIGSAVGGSLAGVAMLVGAVFAIVHSKRKSAAKKSEDDIRNDVGDEANYPGIDEDLE